MELIKSIMGRRQFLAAAGVTSASALALGKFKGIADQILKPCIAGASDNKANSSTKGSTGNYSHLLSPIKIRNTVLKNKIIYTYSTPHFLQGPEIFPSEELRSYYADIAKNAAIITIRIATGFGNGKTRKELTGDSAHMPIWDGEDPSVENYMDQMMESIHCMGSLICGGSLGRGPGSATASIEDIVEQAKALEDQGIDVVEMGGIRSLDDKDALNSAVEQMQAVQKATNLLIITQAMVIDDSLRPTDFETSLSGFTTEEVIKVAKTLEGSADILMVKGTGALAGNPNGFNQEKGNPFSIKFAQAVKESGAKILVAPRAGFHDPDLSEEYIATGKADMIAMARSFIADPEYVKKLSEGRKEDIVPCMMCFKCHGISFTGPWYSVCTVNPKLGITPVARKITPPSSSKKVAVIGGGPAGMKAALTAVERGHKVTLYEKNDFLGGLLRQADFSPFQWPLKEYKDYLIRQVKKAGIDVRLNATATPEMIKAKKYDTVMVALGAEPVISNIPGADDSNVFNIVNVYEKEKFLGKNVVFVGGGKFGVSTCLYLAKIGHNVTALTSEKDLMASEGPHQSEILIDMYQNTDNFSFLTEATAKTISGGKVTYRSRGDEKTIQADSIVIYGGLKPRMDDAIKFYGSAVQFFLIGDCTGRCGDVQKSTRSAFFAASQV